MSRIGRLPIALPANVTVTIKGNDVSIKGPLGELTQYVDPSIKVKVEDNNIILERTSEIKTVKAKHGLYRALLNSNVIGVTKGYEKRLVIAGVGYKAVLQGTQIVLNVGYSHQVTVDQPEGIKLACASPTEIVVSGIDKVAVGQCAANIKAIRKPEPYHGYGIRYKDEVIERKEGKTAGK